MSKLRIDKMVKFKIYSIPIPIPFKLLVIYKIALPISRHYGSKVKVLKVIFVVYTF